MASQLCSSVKILFDAGSSELVLRDDYVHVSSLKLAIEGVFTQLKSANLQMKIFFLRDWLNLNQHHWSQDIRTLDDYYIFS